jgi:hypothetical protein
LITLVAALLPDLPVKTPVETMQNKG